MFNYDKEINILEDLHDLESNECFIVSDKINSKNYLNTAKIIDSILAETYIDEWIDNSKSPLPPDFINKENHLIMEAMRFDDHSSDGKHNPVLARERSMAEEAIEIRKLYPNARFMANAVTDLPTEEDHNYKNLYTGFQRTIRKHLSKLETYKNNYPNCKTIFLVLNETSGTYFESVNGPLGRIHLIFFDNRFLNEFVNSDLDYLILFSPYNHFEALELKEELPKAVIFDIKHLKNSKILQRIEYDEDKMMSNEL